MELFMAAGFAAISYFSGLGIMGEAVVMGILWVTMIIFVMDAETMLVSDWMVVIWAVLVTVLNLPLTPSLVKEGGLGLLVAAGLIGGIWAVTRGKAMGAGDIEIAAVMGWWLGWPKVAVGLWLAFVLGGIYGAALLIQGRKKLKSRMAFGPWLVAGSWIGWIWGAQIVKLLIPNF